MAREWGGVKLLGRVVSGWCVLAGDWRALKTESTKRSQSRVWLKKAEVERRAQQALRSAWFERGEASWGKLRLRWVGVVRWLDAAQGLYCCGCDVREPSPVIGRGGPYGGMNEVKQENNAAATDGLAAIPEGVVCPECGYDLRGLTGSACSECGFALAPVRAVEPQIPWCRRSELGWFPAYWRTVWLAGRRPKRLYLELVRPVSYRDSQVFRWVTFLHAYLAILLVAALCYFQMVPDEPDGREMLTWLFWGVQLYAVAILAGWPGVTSYGFQRRGWPVELQNKLIALNYYAWAPLVLVPLVLVLGVLAWWVAGSLESSKRGYGEWAAIIGTLVFVAVCAGVVIQVGVRLHALARCADRRVQSTGRWRARFVVIGLGLALLLLPGLLLASVAWLLLVWYSLQ